MHSAACSCIIELYDISTLSRIFPELGLFDGWGGEGCIAPFCVLMSLKTRVSEVNGRARVAKAHYSLYCFTECSVHEYIVEYLRVCLNLTEYFTVCRIVGGISNSVKGLLYFIPVF
jgi:hypothetical protein